MSAATGGQTAAEVAPAEDLTKRAMAVGEAEAVVRLRPILACRGFGPDVVAAPMVGLAPGHVAVWPELTATDVERDDLGAMIGPVRADAWLVFTTAGRWWLWDTVAAPADKRAFLAETEVLRRRARGFDPYGLGNTCW